uniref:Uncharacterized protein n=1 Tax=Avena sativa TaxID=4498 RepID=A0ACD5UX46_AVESA
MACALSASTVSPAAALVASPKPTAAPQCLSFPRSFARPARLAAAGSRTARARSFVARAAAENDLPLVGNKAPDFAAEAVFDQEFINVKLSDYIGKKYVILFFYPLDFTFVCPTEITAFSDRHEEFEKINTEILGVSVDSVFSHLAWVQTERKSGGLGDLKYPLVSDVTKSISKSFGVLIADQISLNRSYCAAYIVLVLDSTAVPES